MDKYFKMYRRVAGGGTYLDAFAGSGQVDIRGEIRPGSAALAINSGAFKSLRFYETPEVAKQLEWYLSYHYRRRILNRCKVTVGDCNQQILHDLEAGAIRKEKPCFAFLDPNSTQLSWDTLQALGQYKTATDDGQCRVELFVLLNTHQALMRAREASPVTMDKVMGGRSAWSDLQARGEGPAMYAIRYAERIMDLGYRRANPIRIKDPVSGRPQYYMIHASDHPAAHSFMQWARVETSKEAGEPPLPLFTA